MTKDEVARITPKVQTMVARMMRRYRLDRVSMDEDDATQECLIAILQAHDKFDPSKGYDPDAYLLTCASNRLITLLQTEFYRQRWEQSETVMSGETPLSLLDLMPSAQRPDTDHQRERAVVEFMQGLSPLGRTVCQWLIDPPPALKRQWGALTHKTNLADRVGIEHRETIKEPGFRFIRRILLSMGFEDSTYKKVRKELMNRMEVLT